MNNMPIYEALAQAFAAEGVDTHFTLMGDGNMHWATAMKNLDGMATYAVRHEHCACAMAMGYHLATGKVGVASVTCGPGFTQIMTALSVASRGRDAMIIKRRELALLLPRPIDDDPRLPLMIPH
jgi:acetolactate synthase-1/2/3 large subunit